MIVNIYELICIILENKEKKGRFSTFQAEKHKSTSYKNIRISNKKKGKYIKNLISVFSVEYRFTNKIDYEPVIFQQPFPEEDGLLHQDGRKSWHPTVPGIKPNDVS